MHILTVAGAKGGVGKTTTSIALAAELAMRGYRVALQDLDPQSSATLALDQDPAPDPMGVSAAVDIGERLKLYRGGRALARAGSPEVDALLRSRDDFDVLVIDTPPFLGALTLSALVRADLVLVPVEPAPMALPGLGDVVEALQEVGEPTYHLRAALVRVQSRRSVTGDIRAGIEEAYPGTLYESEIPEDVRCTEAPAFGQPVTLYAPKSRAAEAYHELADEVAADLELEEEHGEA